jgi:death on curing protein
LANEELYRLSVEQVLELHFAVTKDRRLRSKELLESAINQPFQTFATEDLYPTIFDKAASLIRSIAENQPFVDGTNARLGQPLVFFFGPTVIKFARLSKMLNFSFYD